MQRSERNKRLGLLVALLLAGMALAHSDLSSSNPVDGATVTTSLTEVELVFTTQVETAFSIFKVYPLRVDDTAVAEGQHADEGEHAAEGEHAEDTELVEGAEHAEEPEHVEEGGHDDQAEHGAEAGSLHGTLDAAAATLVAEVLGLRGDEAARVDMGTTRTAGASERVSLALRDGLEPGAYVVMWRVLSVDGHTVEGFLTFDYRPAAAAH